MSEASQFRSMAVREMPETDRPRERLEQVGAEALRDAELIAVLFRTGTRRHGAVGLADELFRRFGDLRRLSRASLQELQQVPGIGRVKAIELKAALELGMRLARHQSTGRPKITCARDVFEMLKYEFKEYETEQFKSVLLNTKNEVLRTVTVSTGSITETLAAPGDVFREAVRDAAAAIIVCHNHPSGNPEPSQADLRLTQQLVKAGEILGVSLLDHVVFGDMKFVSLKERQLM
jgi:DNA repair protein RadC